MFAWQGISHIITNYVKWRLKSTSSHSLFCPLFSISKQNYHAVFSTHCSSSSSTTKSCWVCSPTFFVFRSLAEPEWVSRLAIAQINWPAPFPASLFLHFHTTQNIMANKFPTTTSLNQSFPYRKTILFLVKSVQIPLKFCLERIQIFSYSKKQKILC